MRANGFAGGEYLKSSLKTQETKISIAIRDEIKKSQEEIREIIRICLYNFGVRWEILKENIYDRNHLRIIIREAILERMKQFYSYQFQWQEFSEQYFHENEIEAWLQNPTRRKRPTSLGKFLHENIPLPIL